MSPPSRPNFSQFHQISVPSPEPQAAGQESRTASYHKKNGGNSFRGMVVPEDLPEVQESIRRQIASSRFDLDYVEYRAIRRDAMAAAYSWVIWGSPKMGRVLPLVR